MRFTVSNTVTSTANNGDVPGTLSADIPWPPDRTTVDHVFNFQHGGDDLWTINGVDFDDINNRILARPQQVRTDSQILYTRELMGSRNRAQ